MTPSRHRRPGDPEGTLGDDPVAVGNDTSLVLPRRVAHWARADPDRPFLQEVTGRRATYGEFNDLVARWFGWLTELGIQPGQTIGSMLPSSIDAHALWLAAGYAGAIEVAVDPDLRGEHLRHVVSDSGVELCFARSDHVDRDWTDQMGAVRIVTIPPEVNPVADLDAAPLPSPPGLDDISGVIYTSGSSGPAKGVLIPWAQVNTSIGRIPRSWLSAADAAYSFSPMFHVTGRSPLAALADVGGRVVLRDRLSVRSFWPDIRRFGCTVTSIGPVVAILLEPAEHKDDRDNPLHTCMAGSGNPLTNRFAERFDVRIVGGYGSTEVGFPIIERTRFSEPSRLGWLRRGYEARITDDHGVELPDGTGGELWVRPPSPRQMTAGYLGRADLTAAAIVDGWYRTGDLMSRSPDGSFHHIGRRSDTIRRLGENISPGTVEAVIATDPGVVECAVVGVASPAGGEEVLLAVVPTDPATFEPAELYHRVESRLAKHMRPAYISVHDALPRTPSGKVLRREVSTTVSDRPVWSSPSPRATPRRPGPRAGGRSR